MPESKREARQNWALHKDWRTWSVVLLMLGAMAVYVLTLGRVKPGPARPAPGPAQTAPRSP
jgi:hypothetical protein